MSYAVLSFGDPFGITTITTRCLKMGRHAAQIWQRHGFIGCSSRVPGPNASPFPQLQTANCSGQVIWLSHAAARPHSLVCSERPGHSISVRLIVPLPSLNDLSLGLRPSTLRKARGSEHGVDPVARICFGVRPQNRPRLLRAQASASHLRPTNLDLRSQHSPSRCTLGRSARPDASARE